MIYSNEDIYEGNWLEDKKNGYGILEKQNGDKYYGFWNMGLKEGQGYYYYYKTAKIYLGEWHEDNPRCGIFTDVEDDTALQRPPATAVRTAKAVRINDYDNVDVLVLAASPDAKRIASANKASNTKRGVSPSRKAFVHIQPQSYDVHNPD